MKTLHIVPHLRPGSIRRELLLLLGAEGVVCTLAEDASTLGATGARVEALAWKHALDPRPLWRLSRCLRDCQPTTVHVWGFAALRAFRVAAGKHRHHAIVHRPLSGAANLSTLDRWLLRGVDRIFVRSAAEAAACRRLGIAASQLRLVPPGVTPQAVPTVDRRTILCAGPLEPGRGFREAIWTIDILHFLYDDIELVLAGAGSERARLEQFAAATGQRQRIRFVGESPRLSDLLSTAALVWVPALGDAGASIALEAQAASRPVIASRWPGLAEVIQDGVSGFLVPPGDKMALAQATRRLLDDRPTRVAMGEAARRQVSERFGVGQFVQAWSAAG